MTEITDLPLLYEDADFLAVNKPEGLAAIPERAQDKESVLSVLAQKSPQKFYVIDRLDKDVSGVMLLAKNPELHAHVEHLFALRNVTKTYLALVHGLVADDKGSLKKPLREFGSGRMGVDLKEKRLATTNFLVKNRLQKFTLLQVTPATRRRHQIRVHLYSIGHPVVGDPLYGDALLQKKFSRMMLHSAAIEFKRPSPDPLGGETVRIEAALPASFRAILNTL